VCVAVVGRHIPELGYLNVLLGDEPVLAPCERLYERLVALDGKEAAALAAQHVATQGAAATFDTMIIPALALAARDARRGVLEPARARFVFERARRIVETLQVAVGETETAPVCVVAAGDAADHVAALALARLVGAARAVVIEPPAMVAEVLEIGLRRGCRAIVISSVAAHSAHRAGYLARRLRRNSDQLPIIVGLWAAERDVSTTAARLRKLGVNEVVTRLSAAADILHRTAAAPRIIEAHARA